jgi:hypothetical protein
MRYIQRQRERDRERDREREREKERETERQRKRERELGLVGLGYSFLKHDSVLIKGLNDYLQKHNLT